MTVTKAGIHRRVCDSCGTYIPDVAETSSLYLNGCGKQPGADFSDLCEPCWLGMRNAIYRVVQVHAKVGPVPPVQTYSVTEFFERMKGRHEL